MHVVLFGTTGMIGSRVLAELLSRGHIVTAVARDVSRVSNEPNVKAVRGDVLNSAEVAEIAKGSDAVISSYSPGTNTELIVDATRSLIAGLDRARVKRFIEVGGAGSLFVAPNVRLIDAPNFPDEYKAIAIAHADALEVLRKSDLDWTYFSPAAFIQPGERTGKFRLAGDTLVADDKGNSRISAEDYAIALVDELENPKHIRQRFTIGY
ncbi:NAD(P)-dependent oxidoreductase [Alloacidobacterium dinghuense]|uniref:NAD(P)-dependent oxidoreductase n=1 Tax=Alloacidobacterium dinghuense TaxID=2763107 RepID=A0A7G8BLC2_9BACT|nr:NAD(P)-dependent oxidoreductase [Alloacidobacterium dinghuense]QNI33342.1 NAD(P)-dependent oxidoreductase [Alloacidobacterium dinghuense]